MDLYNFLKKNTPAFLASLAISIPASMLYISQYYCAPQVEALKQANSSLKDSYTRLDKSYQERKTDTDKLNSSKEFLTDNLNNKNNELVSSIHSIKVLENEILNLKNKNDHLSSQLNEAIAYNQSLSAQISRYKENDPILLKINKLEAEKRNLRDAVTISVFDNQTDKERKVENEKVADELQQQILDLQKLLKCT
ncbi:hypothetical protein [Acinetobacter radioresistens]|uniref:hypothetical protein n=1 Tax=Acinetobacter radioresistens TaxID=40216 RepID=UPI0032156A63